MALVAMTSVQFTTPMRTFWQEAASAAITLVLRRVLAPSASTQWLISRFMVDPRQVVIMGGGVFVHRAATLRTLVTG
ncbi:hypothetical protein PS3A_48280 [Pseudomonas sp. 3A(2025)]